MPAGTVYVGRPGRWGNPFPADVPTPEGRAVAVARYGVWLAGRPDLVAEARRVLAGRDLACWCPVGQPCHADVLLRVVNSPAGLAEVVA